MQDSDLDLPAQAKAVDYVLHWHVDGMTSIQIKQLQEAAKTLHYLAAVKSTLVRQAEEWTEERSDSVADDLLAILRLPPTSS